MIEYVDVPVSDLLLDQGNARMRDEQDSQQATMLALAEQQGARLVNLAEDIAKHGLDPSTLPCVVATGDRKKRYRVIEGNRRVLALKALDTPSLVTPVLDLPNQRRLMKAAESYELSAPDTVQCVLFDSEDAARHWVEIRHTGENEGVGLVAWGSEEKDRFRTRHGAKQSPAGQVLDFVEQRGDLSPAAKASRTKVITNLARLLNTAEVRDRLGIELTKGDVYSRFPADQVVKSMSRIIEDLKTAKIRVNDIYYAPDRLKYVEGLPKNIFPSPKTQLPVPVLLSDLTAGRQPRPRPTTPPRKKPRRARTALIPKDCQLNVGPPRINSIYNELSTILVEQFPNACSVALRVFLELSVDHYLTDKHLLTETERRNTILAKRLKLVASDLRKNKKIDPQLESAVKRIADGAASSIAASTVTFNQYVHNKYVFPMPTELRTAWDELQPFMEKLWPS